MQDPYGTYAAMRSSGDFVYWADYQMPMAVTHEGVNAVMKNRKLGRARPEGAVADEGTADLLDVAGTATLGLPLGP